MPYRTPCRTVNKHAFRLLDLAVQFLQQLGSSVIFRHGYAQHQGCVFAFKLPI